MLNKFLSFVCSAAVLVMAVSVPSMALGDAVSGHIHAELHEQTAELSGDHTHDVGIHSDQEVIDGVEIETSTERLQNSLEVTHEPIVLKELAEMLPVSEYSDELPAPINDLLMSRIYISQDESELLIYTENTDYLGNDELEHNEVDIFSEEHKTVFIAEIGELLGFNLTLDDLTISTINNAVYYQFWNEEFYYVYAYYNSGYVTKTISYGHGDDLYVLTNSNNVQTKAINVSEHTTSYELNAAELDEFSADLELGLVQGDDAYYTIAEISQYLSEKHNPNPLSNFSQSMTEQNLLNAVMFVTLDESDFRPQSAIRLNGTFGEKIVGSSVFTRKATDFIDVNLYESRVNYTQLLLRNVTIWDGVTTIAELASLFAIPAPTIISKLLEVGAYISTYPWGESYVTDLSVYLEEKWRATFGLEGTTFDNVYYNNEAIIGDLSFNAEITYGISDRDNGVVTKYEWVTGGLPWDNIIGSYASQWAQEYYEVCKNGSVRGTYPDRILAGGVSLGQHICVSFTSSVVTPPTCTAVGKEMTKCDQCGKPVYSDIAKDPNNHNLSDWENNGATGELKYCTRSGCTYTESREHDFDIFWPLGEPTCTSAASKLNDCKNCLYAEDYIVPALGHSGGAGATCTSSQICTRCGVTITGALGHSQSISWSTTPLEHWKACTRSGCSVKLSYGTHSTTSNCGTCGRQHITHTASTSWTTTSTEHWHPCIASGCSTTFSYGIHSSTSNCETCGKQHTSHTPSSSWSTTSTEHWKPCIVAGCSTKLSYGTHSTTVNCSTCGNQHTSHTPSSSWTTTSTEHWKPCTVSGCSAKLSYGTHSTTANCNTCGKQHTTHIPSSSYSTTLTEHWKICTVPNCSAKLSYEPHYATANCATCGKQHTTHTPSSSWSTTSTEHWKTCTAVGCSTKLSYGTHSTIANCNTCGKQHTSHVPSSSWSTTSTEHWKVCTVSGCTTKLSTGTHRTNANCVTCGKQHTSHTSSSSWSTSATEHWKPCTVSGCLTKLSYGTHSTTANCATCGKIHTSHNYNTSWAYTQSTHWHKCTISGCSSTSGSGSHLINGTGTAAICKICGYRPSMGTTESIED